MAFGAIIPSALGSVTAPASITLASAANVTSGLASFGPCDVIPLPSLKAILFTHGVEAMRHVLAGSSYRTGLLAPATGFTATDTATKASSTLTLGAGAGTRPANNDTFNIGQNSSWKLVYWKTTLDTTVNTTQVKIGADVATCLSNLNALIEGTGTHGVEYWDGYQVYISPGDYSPDFWHDSHLIEVGDLPGVEIFRAFHDEEHVGVFGSQRRRERATIRAHEIMRGDRLTIRPLRVLAEMERIDGLVL